MDRYMGLSLDVRGVEGVEGGRGRADGGEENDGRCRRGQQAMSPTVHLFALVRVFFFFFLFWEGERIFLLTVVRWDCGIRVRSATSVRSVHRPIENQWLS
jgi:hypothetical protein